LKQAFEKEDKDRLISNRLTDFYPLYDYYISHNRSIQTPAPSLRQVARMEPFKGLIYDAPADQTLTQGDFLAHMDAVPHLIESWKEDVAVALLGLLPESEKRAVPADATTTKGKEKVHVLDMSILYRATSIFCCQQQCSDPQLMVYPFVYTHRCRNRTDRFGRTDVGTTYALDRADQVGFHKDASRYARAIIGALGQDPDTVTWEQLERDNQRVECVRCRTKFNPKWRTKCNRLVMNWRQAVRHEHELSRHCIRANFLIDLPRD
jgi:hypothetical protein